MRPTLGLLLMPHKQRRVATGALLGELAAAGVDCRPLPADALADGSAAALAGVDAILCKLPADAGALDALERLSARLAVIDPPAAVRAVARRDTMLAPLAGAGLLLEPPPSTPPPSMPAPAPAPGPSALNGPAPRQSPGQAGLIPAAAEPPPGGPATGRAVRVAAPPQAVLLPGMDPAEAASALRAAGVGFPCLVKPLDTRPQGAGAHAAAGSDGAGLGDATGAAAAGAGTAAGAAGGSGGEAPSAAAGQHAVPACGGLEANHAMGVMGGEAGLATLLRGEFPALAPPVVAQAFVPHGERLLKIYVIGPTVIAEPRATLTRGQLADLIAASGGSQLAPLPGRASAAAQPAAAAAAAAADGGADAGGGVLGGVLGGGWAAPPPPEWALRALAARLQEALGLSLFNFDLLVPEPLGPPEKEAGEHPCCRRCGRRCNAGPGEHPCCRGCGRGCDAGPGPQLVYVVDVNYLPGYDKLGDAAQRALGAYLAARTRAAAAAAGAAAAEGAAAAAEGEG
ncbi:hypothetical protein Rsub_06721 [Raphidocelis subcapitata]|uniref:Uncharacterized protein n=1 Tax=Raphidocelis subcapitata TaxID=307507 RepID=A0A2V0P426_9CHLO|nr:hypothetical protein Rsub_06721 [Raphidocelis subcapitata]|eukprot:GBF94606.1 hypothetical protein Rsub_06721 [Raphidocelis subcapitata]